MSQFSSVLMGNESLLVQCGERLLGAGHAIRAVVSRNADVASWAEARGLAVVAPGGGLADRLGGTQFDWLLSIANLDMIPAAVLALPRKGAVNFHDGPLPRHAGLNAPVWALLQGESRHGISWHMIEGGIDEGDILVTRAFDIADSDTALTLNTKAYEAAIDSFPELMAQLEQGLRRVPQDLGPAQLPRAGGSPVGAWSAGFRPARRGAGTAGAGARSWRLCQPAERAKAAEP